MADIKKEFGRKVARLRKAKGWSQEKFAEKIGIAPQNLSPIETGAGFLTAETLNSIIEALEIDAYNLFYFIDENSSDELYATLMKNINFVKDDAQKLKIINDFVKSVL